MRFLELAGLVREAGVLRTQPMGRCGKARPTICGSRTGAKSGIWWPDTGSKGVCSL
jgi:hypothetical protein